MTPDEAFQRQIEAYRRMTGEQRLKIAMEMREKDCETVRAGIRRMFPEANENEVENRFRARLRLARVIDKELPWGVTYLTLGMSPPEAESTRLPDFNAQ